MEEITLQSICEASQTIKGIARRTPIIEANGMKQLYLKMELFQPIGAFKVRGAANKLRSLSPEQLTHGVCAFTSGNHGLAVAYVSHMLGIPATLCMADHVPANKQEAIRRAGGSVVLCGESQDVAEARCRSLVQQKGLTLIPPFDDGKIIAGQGTIGLEILEDLPDADAILVPVSGGGLLSGIAVAAKSINPDIKVIGVCMERSAAMYESLCAGHPVEIPEEFTLADALLGGIGLDNRYTFRLLQQYMDDLILLREEEIAEGMRFLAKAQHVIAEGAGAVGVAAVLAGKIPVRGKTVAVISGGNVGVDLIQKILTAAQ